MRMRTSAECRLIHLYVLAARSIYVSIAFEDAASQWAIVKLHRREAEPRTIPFSATFHFISYLICVCKVLLRCSAKAEDEGVRGGSVRTTESFRLVGGDASMRAQKQQSESRQALHSVQYNHHHHYNRWRRRQRGESHHKPQEKWKVPRTKYE